MDYIVILRKLRIIMSYPSSWPLPENSIRYLLPKPAIAELALNILSRGLYPLSFGKYINAKGHNTRRPDHNDNLMIICFKGKGHYKTEHSYGQINTGDILFVPKGVSHQYNADNTTPWHIYWVHVDGHLFEQFIDFLGINKLNLLLRTEQLDIVINEFEQLLATRHQSYQVSSFILASNILKKILGLLVSSQSSINKLSQVGFNLDKINSFMEENINQQINLTQLAQSMQLSKFHFAKKFQKITGISPISYFIELKVKHACRLLDESNVNIKTVASMVGYDDPYYFSRLFKKVMGLSPSQYRQSRYGH